jgi:hypothetical protein
MPAVDDHSSCLTCAFNERLHDLVHAIGDLCNGIDAGAVRVEPDFVPQIDHIAKSLVTMLWDLRGLAIRHGQTGWVQ